MNATHYSRPLNTPDLVQGFIEIALGYDNDSDLNDLDRIITHITKGELELATISQKENTLETKTFRHRNCKEDHQRWQLRKQIVQELFTLERIDNDDKISLGSGGSCPHSEIKNDSEAYIVIGLPASGKSGISNKIADLTGSVILDSDYAKRKLPEFNTYNSGASLVHLESDALIFPQDISGKPSTFNSLFELCTKNKMNICIPKIGHNHESIKALCDILKNEYKYKIHLILVSLDRRKATIRAINRYMKTDRYVPLGLIFDGYANDPILTYYRLKNKENGLFESFCAISTDVNWGDSPLIVDSSLNTPLTNIYNIKTYE